MNKRIDVSVFDGPSARGRVQVVDNEEDAELSVDGQTFRARLASARCLYEALHEVFGAREGNRA